MHGESYINSCSFLKKRKKKRKRIKFKFLNEKENTRRYLVRYSFIENLKK
jgi:hypothetical protein